MANNRKRSCPNSESKNKKVKITEQVVAEEVVAGTPSAGAGAAAQAAEGAAGSFEADIRAILRANPGWGSAVSMLSDKDLHLLGRRDVLSESEGVSFEPMLQPRKKDLTPVEMAELQEMRKRRNTVVEHVYKLVDGRFSCGFTCTDPVWIDMVKRMVVLAVVGAEGMRGPFEFKSWFIGSGLTENMLDMSVVRALGVPATDFKLMIAIGLFAFIAGCQRVHKHVRMANAVPIVRHGDLLGALRVVFGTFWGPSRKRDPDVLVLASMMLAARFSAEAVQHMPLLLAEIGIPPKEFPVLLLGGHFRADMFRVFLVNPDGTPVEPAAAPEAEAL